MTVILRPGQRILQIPGIGVQTSRRAVSAGGAADWWAVAGKTCVAAYQPKGAASYAASKVNLANPGTYDAADGAAYPTWDASGWMFNGSTQYLTTGYTPTHPASAIVRFSDGNTGAGASCMLGGVDSKQFRLEPSYSGARYYEYGTSYTGAVGAVASGVMCLTPTQGYLIGVADQGTISGGTSLSTVRPLVIGALNDVTVKAFWPGKIQAVAFYSDALTAGEVATVSAAMAAL